MSTQSPWRAPKAPDLGSVSSPPSLFARILILVPAPVLMLVLLKVPMPGIDAAVAQEFLFAVGGDVRFDSFSIGALGVAPIFTAAALMELLFLTRAKTRRLRISGAEGRRSLNRIVAVAALAVAGIQASAMTQTLPPMRLGNASLVGPNYSAAVLVLTLVAVTAMWMAYARLIDERGLGSGYAWLLVSAALIPLGEWALNLFSWLLSPNVSLPQFLGIAGLGTATIWGTWRFIQHAKTSISVMPVAGLIPLNSGLVLVTMVYTVVWGIQANPTQSSDPKFWLSVAVSVFAATAAWDWVFNRASTVADRSEPVKQSALALVALTALIALATQFPNGLPFTMLVFVVVAASDLVDEYRARQARTDLVPVWPLHRLYRLREAQALLAAHDIPHFAEAVHTRAVLQFFGPLIPVRIWVPAAHRATATTLLTDLLAPSSV